jgi:putative ATPase
MKQMGYGKEYRYAHDEPDAYAAGASWFPDDVPPQRWYHPAPRGMEIRIGEKLAALRALDDEAEN